MVRILRIKKRRWKTKHSLDLTDLLLFFLLLLYSVSRKLIVKLEYSLLVQLLLLLLVIGERSRRRNLLEKADAKCHSVRDELINCEAS